MSLYTFTDAKTRLKRRLGNRTDFLDADYGKFINQAQAVISTNVKGLDGFDEISTDKPLAIGFNHYVINSGGPQGLTISDLWAVTRVRLTAPTGQILRRGERDVYYSYATIPDGTPVQWITENDSKFLIFFQKPVVATSVIIHYRRKAVADVLEVPDEWFEHLLNLAAVFAYPEIGRNKERDVLFQKLPQQLQIGMLNPLTPSQWEAQADQDLSFYR